MSLAGAGSDSWLGSILTDRHEHRLGTITEIYLDEEDGRPLWMVVRTRRFGTGHRFVPIEEAVSSGETVMTPYDRERIEGSPRLDAAEDLSDDQVQKLYDYYSLEYRAHGAAIPRTSPVERVLMYLA